VKAPASATIINAMATGSGSAFGIDLNNIITAKIVDSGFNCVSDIGADPKLMYKCVDKVLEFYNLNNEDLEFGLEIETESHIPLGSGLSSSSALSNAVTLAVASLISDELNFKPLTDMEVINLGIDASLDCGVTITGSFDDATASFFGGVLITDNFKREIIYQGDMLENNVLIFMGDTPSLSGSVDLDRIKLLSPLVDMAFEKACQKDFYNALNLNGLIYGTTLQFNNEIAISALKAGALCSGLSGSGSAFVAIVDDDCVDDVKDAWSVFDDGEIIETKVNNEGTKLLD
jgi:shikimate kinase